MCIRAVCSWSAVGNGKPCQEVMEGVGTMPDASTNAWPRVSSLLCVFVFTRS